MNEITFVIKRSDEDLVVYSTEFPMGYNVVPKSVDKYNAFDIKEVKDWCKNNPDKVRDEITEIPNDISEYINSRDSIKSDLQYLKDTDDVDYQLARHERGTQILSDEKLADCMEKDRRRGEIASTIKSRRESLSNMLGELQSKYGLQVLINFGII